MKTHNPFVALLRQASALFFEGKASHLAGWLLSPHAHSVRLTTRRVKSIVLRVQVIAATMAVLSPLWVIIDHWTLTPEVYEHLGLIRTLGAVALAAVIIVTQGVQTLGGAYRALFFLFAVPAAFYLFANVYILHNDADGVLDGFALGFAYFPFVMLAGLSLFPLAILESAALVVFVLAVHLVVSFGFGAPADLPGFFGSIAVCILIALVGVFSGVSQLAHLITIVHEGLRDNLTGVYSRRAGEDFLDLQFVWAQRTKLPLAVAIVEIDGLHEVNEKFGFTTGDRALTEIAQRLNDSLRSGDTLFRWAGNQFLLAFPCATEKAASAVLDRLLQAGLDVRPDGRPYTLSIGVVERMQESAEDWWSLVDLAAKRMAKAKQSGGNRTIGHSGSPDAGQEIPAT